MCNACESLLLDEDFAKKHLAEIVAALKEKGVEIVACGRSRKIVPELQAASEEDFYTEFLDMKISIRIVDGVDDAIACVNRYGTHHSDTIVTNDERAAEKFLQGVDSAAVYWNASTRFTDGFEFGSAPKWGSPRKNFHARRPYGIKRVDFL